LRGGNGGGGTRRFCWKRLLNVPSERVVAANTRANPKLRMATAMMVVSLFMIQPLKLIRLGERA
jgi:hypothetical protein